MATSKIPQTKAAAPAPTRTAGRLKIPLIKAKTKLTDLAYDQIEEAIVTLRIPPGTAISEQSLSDITGIGRTPIREAIQRLAREHLVLVLPQRGLLVSQIDVSKQLRLLETRRELERLICRAAAKRSTEAEKKMFASLAEKFTMAATKNDDVSFIRADRDFNELCLKTARNEFAESAMRVLHGLSRRFWFLHYKQAADLPEMARLHAAVALAISEGNVEEAGSALDRQLDNIEAFTRATVP